MRLPTAMVRTAVRLGSRWTADPAQPFAVQRRRYEHVSSMPLPRGTTVERTHVAGVPVERVAAPGATGTVVHLHGGGFCIGSPATHRAFAARLSVATGSAVVVPDYRLAPEHPAPAAADDAYAVWSQIAAEHPEAVLSGDSAGGALALQTVVRARDTGGPLPPRLVLLSPFVDATADHGADPGLVARDVVLSPDWITRCALSYAGGRPLDDPRVSAIRLDLQGLPPTLVVWGTDEILAPGCERLVEKLRAAQTEVRALVGDGLWHVYPTQAGLLGAADEAVAAIAEFAREVTVR